MFRSENIKNKIKKVPMNQFSTFLYNIDSISGDEYFEDVDKLFESLTSLNLKSLKKRPSNKTLKRVIEEIYKH